jgi:hypothetical protein
MPRVTPSSKPLNVQILENVRSNGSALKLEASLANGKELGSDPGRADVVGSTFLQHGDRQLLNLDWELPPRSILEKLRNGYACFYPELPWGSPPAWKESGHPTTTWLVTWEAITCVACIWVALSLPYASFIDGAKALPYQQLSGCAVHRWGDWPPSGPSLYAGVDLACDILFAIDLAINFLTAKWVIKTQGREEWNLISDLTELRAMYMFRVSGVFPVPQFWVDFAGVVPWQYLECFPTIETTVRLFRVIRLVKLTRLYRLMRMLEQLRFAYPAAKFVISISQLVCVIMLVAHWMCCLWFIVGYTPEGWVVRTDVASVIEDAEGLEPHERLLPTAYVQNSAEAYVGEWLASFYWAITTMTTIGYGDISAVTLVERLFSCITMMIGCCFFAWSTGLITSLITDTPYSVSRFNDTMDELNEFMSSRGLSSDLTERLRSFYMLKFPTMRIYDDETVMSGLPTGLARSVKFELFQDLLSMSPFFYGMDVHIEDQKQYSHVAGDICASFQMVYKTIGLHLTQAGELPDSLYIVRTGMLSVMANGRETFIAKAGDVVGEMALLGFSSDGCRIRTSVCLTMCELCQMSRESVEQLLALEGFRVPFRRLIGAYVDGLAASVVGQEQEGQSDTHYFGSQDENTYAFDHIPWRNIRERLQEADDYHNKMLDQMAHNVIPPKKHHLRSMSHSMKISRVENHGIKGHSMPPISRPGLNCIQNIGIFF